MLEREKILLNWNESKTLHYTNRINQDFFKTWSRDMAYVLGLWFADGTIYGDKIFDITIHVRDKYILKKVKELLAYEGPITDFVDKQVARLNFSCAIVYKDIQKLGGNNMDEFPHIPEDYLSDFIRGYFDGKGNVCNVRGRRINVIFANKNEKFLNGLLDILRKEVGVEGGSYCASSKTLRFGKKDSIKIGEYMYKDVKKEDLFLLRKKKKFDVFLLKEEQ